MAQGIGAIRKAREEICELIIKTPIWRMAKQSINLFMSRCGKVFMDQPRQHSMSTTLDTYQPKMVIYGTWSMRHDRVDQDSKKSLAFLLFSLEDQ